MMTRPSRLRGFTFLEMALSLFILGFMLSAVPNLISQSQPSMAAAPGATPHESAALNLTGFVTLNFRLPCPAATPQSGVEDCTRSKGFVPFKTLGLPRPVTNAEGFDFAYAIHTDEAHNNHLGKATPKYTPQYLDSSDSYWLDPATLSSAQVNGLDFCAKLREAAVQYPRKQTGSPGVKVSADPAQGLSVAWVLVDPGKRNADGNVGSGYPKFDGSNDPSSNADLFESPSRPATETYDDVVTVGTFGQLYGELKCVDLLASVSAAAREADFANDNWRVRKFLYDFRDYELKVRKQMLVQAENMKLSAIFDVVMTVTGGLLDLGISTSSIAGKTAVYLGIVNSMIALAISSYELEETIKGINEARDEVAEGQSRLDDAAAALTKAQQFRQDRRLSLLLLDLRGWFK